MSAELAANKPLLESGDVGLAEVMRLERAVAQAEVELTTTRNQYFQSLQEQFAEVDAELMSAREVLKQRQVTLEAMTVVAPVSGVVKQIGFTTVGAVVGAATRLWNRARGRSIGGRGEDFPGDIAFVAVGQQASVNVP